MQSVEEFVEFIRSAKDLDIKNLLSLASLKTREEMLVYAMEHGMIPPLRCAVLFKYVEDIIETLDESWALWQQQQERELEGVSDDETDTDESDT